MESNDSYEEYANAFEDKQYHMKGMQENNCWLLSQFTASRWEILM